MACLTVSAVILACMLLLEMVTEPAQAEVGATSRAGYFSVCTASESEGESLMWIANVNTQRMIVCERQREGVRRGLRAVRSRPQAEAHPQPLGERPRLDPGRAQLVRAPGSEGPLGGRLESRPMRSEPKVPKAERPRE